MEENGYKSYLNRIFLGNYLFKDCLFKVLCGMDTMWQLFGDKTEEIINEALAA